MKFPDKACITEVGPRDGLQMEKRIMPTGDKVEWIAGMIEAGLRSIQVAAFVHPGVMPQMADAEALIERLPHGKAVAYSALTLNLKGVERACRTSIPWIEVSFSASDAHSRRNAGFPLSRAVKEMAAMTAAALKAGRRLRASVQCAFGYQNPSDVPAADVMELVRALTDQGVELLLLADTAGLATPSAIEEKLGAVLPLTGAVPVGLHLHDTRGFGESNLRAALSAGLVHFDTAIGGLGGCPFIPGARGNIATETTVRLLERMGIATGIDAARLDAWARRVNHFFGCHEQTR
jgi:hydroxymethylglutaryl-CoA lyase